jgi:hypothetical protein
MQRSVLSILVLILLFGFVRQTDSYDFERAVNKTCVPQAEMQMAGVRLGDGSDTIRIKLGEPTHENTQDGLEVYIYSGVEIQLHAARAQRVTCHSPLCATPSGIRPGEPLERVSQILGFDVETIQSPHRKVRNQYHIHRCIGRDELMDVEQHFSFEVDDNHVLSSIAIFWVAP